MFSRDQPQPKEATWNDILISRASHRTVYGIRPYSHGTVTGNGSSVYRTVDLALRACTVRYGHVYGRMVVEM